MSGATERLMPVPDGDLIKTLETLAEHPLHLREASGEAMKAAASRIRALTEQTMPVLETALREAVQFAWAHVANERDGNDVQRWQDILDELTRKARL